MAFNIPVPLVGPTQAPSAGFQYADAGNESVVSAALVVVNAAAATVVTGNYNGDSLQVVAASQREVAIAAALAPDYRPLVNPS